MFYNLSYAPSQALNGVQLALSRLSGVDASWLGYGDQISMPNNYVFWEECSFANGQAIAEQILLLNPPPVAVIGPFCSETNEGLYAKLSVNEIPIISYGAASPQFDDVDNFFFFLRIDVSTTIQCKVLATVLTCSS